MYSGSAAFTVSFLVRCPPILTASSTSSSSIPRLSCCNTSRWNGSSIAFRGVAMVRFPIEARARLKGVSHVPIPIRSDPDAGRRARERIARDGGSTRRLRLNVFGALGLQGTMASTSTRVAVPITSKFVHTRSAEKGSRQQACIFAVSPGWSAYGSAHSPPRVVQYL
jgi:hypothetical protein